MRILITTLLALSFASAAQAEQAKQQPAQGYYYYPQPSFYGGYAPYGYQAPGYRTAQPKAPTAKTPAKAKAAEAATAKQAEPAKAEAAVAHAAVDPERYPVAEPEAIEAASGSFRVEEGRFGPVLADAEGRTLYVAFPQPRGATPCDPSCANLWRPYLAGAMASANGLFALVQRESGSRQWSYDGRPLYQWLGDQDAGEVTGDGVDGTWFAIRIRRG
ncbi:COG4315 family predicted lipoprotein [Thiorhodococcus minor]|uniref:Uncharacterized protein n=1 Tax=Thiorhodococcus minor TaxID=57489 RepID=A0A6M0K758_9GAMM|nr:hypothetical protein [Thiorhodococcus minor]NEV64185.1 hypothetical protein [Thiorhodococcus minor]